MTTVTTQEEKVISLKELQNVLAKMDFYKKTWGFIANDLSGDLNFFDNEPSFGGAYVTREDILNYINSY